MNVPQETPPTPPVTPQTIENPLARHLASCRVRIQLSTDRESKVDYVRPLTPLGGPGLEAVVDWMCEYGATALKPSGLFHPQDFQCLKRVTSLRHLGLHGCRDAFNDEAAKCLGELRALECLDLTLCPVTGKGLEVLAKLPALRELTLGNNDRIMGEDLAFLSRMPALRRMSLDPNSNSKSYLPYLEKVNLEYLGYVVRLKTAKDIEQLARLTTLKEVRFELASNEIDCSALKRLVSLEAIYLPYNPSLLKILPEFPRMASVSAGDLGIDQLDVIARLPQLRELAFSIDWRAPSDQVVKRLARMRGLTSLQLRGGELKADQFGFLAELSELRKLVLPPKADPKALTHAKHCTNLNVLEIGCGGLKNLITLSSLRRLKLSGPGKGLDSKALARLAECPCLEELELYDIQPTARELEQIVKIASLRRLKVGSGGFECDDAMLEVLSTRPDLDLSQNLLRFASTTPKGITSLAKISRIDPQIWLEGQWKATDLEPLSTHSGITGLGVHTDAAGLKQVARIPRLATLELHIADDTSLAPLADSKIGGLHLQTQDELVDELKLAKDAAPTLASMEALTDLDLFSSPIDDTFVEQLAKLPHLAKVNLNASRLTDNAMASFAKMVALRSLKLSDAGQITDRGLAALADRGLIELSVSRAPAVTGAGLGGFRGKATLRKLSLAGSVKLGDAEVEIIVGLQGLQELDIAGTLISNRALDLLGKTSLTRLEIRGCRRLSFAKVRAFREEMRNRTPHMSVFEDAREALPKEKTATWKAERKLAKKHKVEKPGSLNEAVLRELKRLGAKPGQAGAGAGEAEWPAALQVLAGYQWPASTTYEAKEDDGDLISPDGIEWGNQPSTDELAEYRCLQDRPFWYMGLADGGNYYLAIPIDTDMPEDPPIYILDHASTDPDEAYDLIPERLSEFLARVKAGVQS